MKTEQMTPQTAAGVRQWVSQTVQFVALAALLLVIRTALEDRTLIDELPGYADYAARVRWRLLPGVW